MVGREVLTTVQLDGRIDMIRAVAVHPVQQAQLFRMPGQMGKQF